MAVQLASRLGARVGALSCLRGAPSVRRVLPYPSVASTGPRTLLVPSLLPSSCTIPTRWRCPVMQPEPAIVASFSTNSANSPQDSQHEEKDSHSGSGQGQSQGTQQGVFAGMSNLGKLLFLAGITGLALRAGGWAGEGVGLFASFCVSGGRTVAFCSPMHGVAGRQQR